MAEGTLTVEILEGINLAPKDKNGLSDPYCEVSLLQTSSKKEKEKEKGKKKTKVISETLNPTWNETYHFGISQNTTALKIVCWDKDRISRDFMGEVTIPISDFLSFTELVVRSYPVQQRKSSDVISGELKIGLHYEGGELRNSATEQNTSFTVTDVSEKKKSLFGRRKKSPKPRSSSPYLDSISEVGETPSISERLSVRLGGKKKEKDKDKILESLRRKEQKYLKRQENAAKKGKTLSSRDQQKLQRVRDKKALLEKDELTTIEDSDDDTLNDLSVSESVSERVELPKSSVDGSAILDKPLQSDRSASPRLPSSSSGGSKSGSKERSTSPRFGSSRMASTSAPFNTSTSSTSSSTSSASPNFSASRKKIGSARKEESRDRSPKPSVILRATGKAIAGETYAGYKEHRDHEGFIILEVFYYPAVKSGNSCFDGALQVVVKGCKDLTPKDANGLADPYVLLSWGDQQEKTRVLKKTLNPIFDSEFQFSLIGDANKLSIEVWDWDRVGTDELIGGCSLSISDLKPHPDLNSVQLQLTLKTTKEKSSKRKSLQVEKQPKKSFDISHLESRYSQKRERLLELCLEQERNSELEREKMEKLEILKQTEARVYPTKNTTHSNEDVKMVYFFAVILAFAIFNVLFHHFLASVWAEYGDEVEQFEELVVSSISDSIQDAVEVIEENYGEAGREAVDQIQEKLGEVAEDFQETIQEKLGEAVEEIEEVSSSSWFG